MARREAPPQEWKPTQAVPDPILNNPYDEPTSFWQYRDGVPVEEGGRRPARYYYKSHGVGSAQQSLLQDEYEEDLPLVNALRADVKRWRESGYRGATAVTRDLLKHWTSTERARRLFFCQREAVETLIYLLELAIPGRLGASGFRSFEVDADNMRRLLAGEMPNFTGLSAESFYPRLVDASGNPDELPLRRLGVKMATGSGKTIVMAMLVAWAFCNRGRNPQSTYFPAGVLVCAPNLTVRKRLSVLKPEDPDNYYEAFDLVPLRYREFLQKGKVLVTNWHAFAPKSEHSEGGTSYTVVQKGEESPEAFARDRLGELAARLPILVLNDEGHHCWRPRVTATADVKKQKKELQDLEKELSKDEREDRKEDEREAKVWLAGLDRINNSGLAGRAQGQVLPGILACVDMSATPFFLANSGHPEGSPFPWLISDFGLVDAIECGITKVPRLPVMDDSGSKDEVGRPDAKYFRLWDRIKESCQSGEKLRNAPRAEAVYKYAEEALTALASQWKIQFDQAQRDSGGRSFIPPVMIVVCDNTDVAQIFYEMISGETEEDVPDPDKPGKVKRVKRYGASRLFPELTNSEQLQRTIRIDSKLLDKIEQEGGETKDQAALRLRELIDTVGKPGGLGAQVRCVVSVSMLTEGWDANNVTQVLGVRAFRSQLLCEQVVGRGLRRMNYDPDPVTGKLRAEYVDVYGIPFSLIPYKGKPKEEKDKPDPVYHSIHPVVERAAYEMRLPVVDGYVYDLKEQGISCDVSSLEVLHVDDTVSTTWVRPTRGYAEGEVKPQDDGDWVEQTRDEFYKTVRPQQVLFRLTQQIVDDLLQGQYETGDTGRRNSLKLSSRQQLFPEVLSIVQQYIEKRVVYKVGLDARELAHQKHFQLLVERIRDNILPVAAKKGRLLPLMNRFHPSNSTNDVNESTNRPVMPVSRSHLNAAVIHSSPEAQAVDILEDMAAVECYTPNIRALLQVPYEYDGQRHSYEPDFLVRLHNGVMVMLEIKGGKGRIHDPDKVPAKNTAARKWCDAVSNTGKFGQWVFEICDDTTQLRKQLQQHAGTLDALPFELVDTKSLQPWVNAVPLLSLHRLAMQEQKTIQLFEEKEFDAEWVVWKDHPEFEKGMFVARVPGSDLEPEVDSNSYCLFRAHAKGEDLRNRILAVRHASISDPVTGGNWTVRRLGEERVSESTDWSHTVYPLLAVAEGVPTWHVESSVDNEMVVLGVLVASLLNQ